MGLLWTILIVTVAALLLLDVGFLHRRITQMSLLEALALSGFWIIVGLCFALFVYYSYESGWTDAALTGTSISGKQAVTEYLTAYLLEKSLSLDNLFVIALIFLSLNIPLSYQHRVLFYGIVGAIILRLFIIIGGIQLIGVFHWLNYVFAFMLLFYALRLFTNQTYNKAQGESKLIKLITRFIPLRDTLEDNRFIIRTGAGLMITPLFVAMIMIESADLVFAVDSIPAALAISHDPFIVASSNIFAILGLRALYFVLASAIQQMHYLKVSLIAILLFVAVKMLLIRIYPIDTMLSLLLISGILLAGIVASLMQKDRGPVFATSPLAASMGRLYNLTFLSLKRIVILVLGTSVLIVGIIMIVAPGPAIVVIPAGLAILATEFVWARVILTKFKHKFVHYGKETMNLFKRKRNQSTSDRGNQ